MIAAAIVKTKKYARIFKTNQATNAGNSIIPADHGISNSHIFNRMVRQGIIKNTGDGRYYLDEVREKEARENRHKFLLVLFATLLIIGIAAYFISGASS
ncbi:MAG: hypothetical protein ABIQ31_06205 [Ferruginibacter sp.]